MFQKSAHDGNDADIVRFARDPGQKAADSPYDEGDFDAALAREIEPIYHLPIGERIHLGYDACGAARFGKLYLLVDAFQKPFLQALRRD